MLPFRNIKDRSSEIAFDNERQTEDKQKTSEIHILTFQELLSVQATGRGFSL
jgi:hypothetical protein